MKLKIRLPFVLRSTHETSLKAKAKELNQAHAQRDLQRLDEINRLHEELNLADQAIISLASRQKGD